MVRPNQEDEMSLTSKPAPESPFTDEKDLALDANKDLAHADMDSDTPSDASSEDGIQAATLMNLPWRLKAPALLCVVCFTLGSNFVSSALPPLKSTIKREIPGVSNARFGALVSAEQLINALLPVFAGVINDYYGPSVGSMSASIACLVGSVIAAIGGTKGSYAILLVGQIIFGFGSIIVETSQDTLYSHWARGSAAGGVGFLGLMYGLDVAVGRVFNLAGKLSAVPIAEQTGHWWWTLWVGAILCLATLLINLAYVMIERRLPAKTRVMTGRQLAKRAELGNASSTEPAPRRSKFKKFFLTVGRSLTVMPASFWLIMITHLLQAGVISSYVTNLADTISVTRGYSARTAGYTGAITQAIPIALTPLFGIAFDLFGYRMHTLPVITSIWILVFALLAYTTVHAYVPVVLGSLALAGNAIPFSASIPLLVSDQSSMGTAFGIWQAFNAAGTTVIETASGAIQDYTPTGKDQYNNVFFFLIALKAVDLANSVLYLILDKRQFGGVFKMSERQRVNQELSEDEKDRTTGMRAPKRSWTVAGLAVGVALIVVSYVVYIVYSIGG